MSWIKEPLFFNPLNKLLFVWIKLEKLIRQLCITGNRITRIRIVNSTDKIETFLLAVDGLVAI